LKIIILIFVWLCALHTIAQDASDYVIGVHADLVKTDNASMFGKAQLGAEVNYFVNNKFTVGTGLEVWTSEDFSFVIGARYYPGENGFIRLRGLVGENDLSIGGGWVKPLSDNVRMEAIADFYFSIDFSIRAGIVYVIRRD
jgi:hypothetical protein